MITQSNLDCIKTFQCPSSLKTKSFLLRPFTLLSCFKQFHKLHWTQHILCSMDAADRDGRRCRLPQRSWWYGPPTRTCQQQDQKGGLYQVVCSCHTPGMVLSPAGSWRRVAVSWNCCFAPCFHPLPMVCMGARQLRSYHRRLSVNIQLWFYYMHHHSHVLAAHYAYNIIHLR